MTLREPRVYIDSRYKGPPGSANGGYVCGLLAERVGGAAEVTLRAPPPLERELTVRTADGVATLYDGDKIIAEATRRELELDVPAPLSYEQAERAARRYSGFDRHVFPTCFVCGPQRGEGDGLRIFAGPVDERRSAVAAPWVPSPGLADSRRLVRNEIVWAALDCPGAFAIGLEGERVLVLGRMTARIDKTGASG